MSTVIRVSSVIIENSFDICHHHQNLMEHQVTGYICRNRWSRRVSWRAHTTDLRKQRKPRAECAIGLGSSEPIRHFCKSREPISPDTSFDIIHTAKRLLYKLDNNYMP